MSCCQEGFGKGLRIATDSAPILYISSQHQFIGGIFLDCLRILRFGLRWVEFSRYGSSSLHVDIFNRSDFFQISVICMMRFGGYVYEKLWMFYVVISSWAQGLCREMIWQGCNWAATRSGSLSSSWRMPKPRVPIVWLQLGAYKVTIVVLQL